MNRAILAVFFGTTLSSCPLSRPVEDYEITVNPPFEAGDGSALKTIPECKAACENLANLGCPESAAAGGSCGSVCTAAELNGFDLRLACVATAKSVAEVRSCCPKGTPGCSPVLCGK